MQGHTINQQLLNSLTMLNLSHKSLDVWRASILLVKKVYNLTEQYPNEEKFGLVSQMRRSAIFVSSNISEGASRTSGIEKKRFYEIARSSLVELDTQLIISEALAIIGDEDMMELDELMNKVFAKLTVMRRNIKPN